MNYKNNIFILSQPIQSGKTTLLMKWIDDKNVGGILTPDIDNKRMLYDIVSKTYSELQLDDDKKGIEIGKFVFSENGFELARTILLDAIHADFDWLIVDEIGRLEIDRNQGLEPAIAKLIEHFKTSHTKTKLLLVIRDYLFEPAIKHYEINKAVVLHKEFFVQQPIVGLVLCGGNSKRMGTDKAFITYHQALQYKHIADMMMTYMEDVFISCNKQQSSEIEESYITIVDDEKFANAGPMTGVLTAFDKIKNSAFLLMGCDYPFFNQDDMLRLLEAREEGMDVVCYYNNESNFEEPLLAVYEKQCAPLLHQYFKQGNTSLRQFLKTVATKTILPLDIKSIQSVDTREAYLKIKAQNKSK